MAKENCSNSLGHTQVDYKKQKHVTGGFIMLTNQFLGQDLEIHWKSFNSMLAESCSNLLRHAVVAPQHVGSFIYPLLSLTENSTPEALIAPMHSMHGLKYTMFGGATILCLQFVVGLLT